MSTERRALGGILTLVLAVTAAAALVAPPGAKATAPATAAATPPSASAHYCPRYDAYELDHCGPRHVLPDDAAGRQLRWALDQLAGGASTLTLNEVQAHMTDGLQRIMSPRQLLGGLRHTVAERGPMRFVGFSYPPRREQATAIVAGAPGVRGAVALGTDGGLIDSLEIDDAPPTIVPRGPHSGLFDVGGRRMFLRCTGQGKPTVVLENGLTSDWYRLQNHLAPLTRVCSYDPARMAGPWGRSDPAAAPRDGIDRVTDLHRLLRTADVPGPYVLAGHSNGGLFSLLYASRHPAQAAGMVLIDGVHPAYHRRSIRVARRFVPRDHWDELAELVCRVPPVQEDAEQMDICRAEAQTRRALARSPLRAMPLVVLTRTLGSFPPGTPNAAQDRLWRRLQNELAAQAPGSRHIFAKGSGHDIHQERPGLVLRQIAAVITAVRAGRHSLDPPEHYRR